MTIQAAEAAYQKAGERLMETVKREFPVGCIVTVTLGKAHVTGEVTGHSGSWWYHPATVRIRNLTTGKTREFCATYEGHEARRHS